MPKSHHTRKGQVRKTRKATREESYEQACTA